MHLAFWRGLRSRLMLLVVCAVLPALAVVAYSSYVQYQMAASEARTDVSRLVRLAAVEPNQLIVQTRQLASTLSQFELLRNPEESACSQFLDTLRRREPLYANLAVVRLDGSLACAAQPPAESVNVGDAPWFKAALASHELSAPAYQAPGLARVSTIAFGYPILDAQDRMTGVLALLLDAQAFGQRLTDALAPSGDLEVLVLAADRTILARQPANPTWSGRALADSALAQRALSGREGVADLVGVDGVRRLYSFLDLTPSYQSGIVVVGGIPVPVAYAAGHRLLVNDIVILCAALLIGLLAAWGGSEHLLLRRLRAIVAATRNVAIGDLRARTGGDDNDASEIAELAAAFDHMADALEQRDAEHRASEQALRASEERFRLLAENSPDVVFSLTLQPGPPHLDYISAAVCALTGYTPDALYATPGLLRQITHDDDQRLLSDLVATPEAAPRPALLRWRHKDGHQVWAEVRLASRKDANGVLVGLQGVVRDISERVQMERTQRRYDLLSVHTRDIILFVRYADGKIVDANSAALRAYGYTREELLNLSLTDLRLPDTYESMQHQLDKANTTGLTFETVHRRQNGSAFPVEVSSQGADVAGERLLLSIVRDITENKRAQAELRAAKARYEGIFTYSNDAIILIRDGRMIDCNPATLKMLRCRVADLLGHSPVVIMLPPAPGEMADADLLPQRLAAAEAGEPQSYDGLRRRFDGSVFNAEISLSCIDLGDEKFVLAMLRDVTERREAQAKERQQRQLAEALRDAAAALGSTLDSEELLDRVLETLGGVVPNDGAAVMLFADGDAHPARARTTGSAELQAWLADACTPMRSVPALQRAFAERRPVVLDDVFDIPEWNRPPLPEPGRSFIFMPILVRGQTAGLFHVASHIPRFYHEADAEHLQAFAGQVSMAIENARLYEEVRGHAAELERRVAERTAELSETAERLQAANVRLTELDRLKSQFVSNVSHELRTPLSNIILYLSLLESGRPEKRERYMATLNRETALLHRLIEDVLQVSRIDLGKLQPDLRSIDLNTLLAQLTDDRAALIAARGLDLETRFDAELESVVGDERMLTQIVTNLVTNAMNYTPAGGMIRVSTQHLDDQGRRWSTFAIQDTGPGISPADLEHLFDRFYRGENARQGNIPGTGLGLSICQDLVRLQAGRITVESEPGQGSTFVVWLPARGG